jgi:transcriptional regulator with XRE-family HTH domain
VTQPDPAEETVGQRIKRVRLERGLTQRSIAGPGVTSVYVSRIESGQRRPSVRVIRMLASKLGVSPEYLETGVDLPPSESLELRLTDAELWLRLGEDDASEAEETLGAVLQEAKDAALVDLATRAQVSIGLHEAHKGRHREAIEQLAAAVDSGLVSALAHPRVYTALADCYRFIGRPEEAANVLQRALLETESRAPGDHAAKIRFASKLSGALADLGRFDEAHEALAKVDDFQLRDPYARIRVLWSLARLAAIEGEPRVALGQLREAITLLATTEDSLQLARAHLFAAEIMLFSGKTAEAGPNLKAAERLFGLGADQRDLGAVRANQALYEARTGSVARALELGEEALDLLADVPADQATAWLAIGAGRASRDETDLADTAFGNAVEQLTASNLRREAAQACREWSAMLRAAGRIEEALDVAERAAALAAARTVRV